MSDLVDGIKWSATTGDETLYLMSERSQIYIRHTWTDKEGIVRSVDMYPYYDLLIALGDELAEWYN